MEASSNLPFVAEEGVQVIANFLPFFAILGVYLLLATCTEQKATTTTISYYSYYHQHQHHTVNQHQHQ